MSQRLPRAVGWLKARELSFTTDIITARQAEEIGLVNITVASDKLEETIAGLARKIMANSLEAVAACKYLYNQGLRDTMEKGLERESRSEFSITDTQSRIVSFRKKKSGT